MSKLEELKLEADSLGIKYQANIGEAKLQERIDEFYKNESEANTVKVEVKQDEEKDLTATEKQAIIDAKPDNELTPEQLHRRHIANLERKNRETKIVVVTMVDKKEASVATSYYVGVGSIGMEIPLDVAIELPIILIKSLRKKKVPVAFVDKHGMTQTKLVPKFVVEEISKK